MRTASDYGIVLLAHQAKMTERCSSNSSVKLMPETQVLKQLFETDSMKVNM